MLARPSTSPRILHFSYDTSLLLGYFTSPRILHFSYDTSLLLGYFRKANLAAYDDKAINFS